MFEKQIDKIAKEWVNKPETTGETTESEPTTNAGEEEREYVIDTKYLGYFESKTRIKPSCIVVHHTCTANSDKTRKHLKSNGFSTHFEVEKDGHIYQYMETNLKANHCGSSNTHAIGVDVTHMKDAKFPEEQVKAVRWLVRKLCKENGIPLELHMELSGIYPHKAIGSTVCPQDFPMEELVK